MLVYETPDPYMVIAFDEVVEIRPEPITIAGKSIIVGDKITAITGEKTSAGFGSFKLRTGFITYAGRYSTIDERGPHEYILFDYAWRRDIFGTINGHKLAYVGWIVFQHEDENVLFYHQNGAGRLIEPKCVKYLEQ